jgi:surface antigen
MNTRPLLLGTVLLFTTSCGTILPAPTPGVKTLLGAGGGGAAGGLLGAKLSGGNGAITAAGALLGLLVGGGVGSLLDSHDKQSMTAALQRAVQSPTDTVVPWTTSRGDQGTITSGVWGLGADGPCRRFTVRAMIDGRLTQVEGCAVQRPDGTWEVQR